MDDEPTRLWLGPKKGFEALGNETPFLLVYYGSDGDGSRGWQSLDLPLRTITTLDSFRPGETRRKCGRTCDAYVATPRTTGCDGLSKHL